MINSEVKVTGKLNVVLEDEFGNVKDEFVVPNLVVTTGLNFIASRMIGTTSAAMSHMGIGTSTTAAAVGQTALVTQIHRNALTEVTNTANAVTYKCVFTPGQGTGAITEAGIFNASSNGTMLCRTVFSVINKSAGDTLTITWTVTIN